MQLMSIRWIDLLELIHLPAHKGHILCSIKQHHGLKRSKKYYIGLHWQVECGKEHSEALKSHLWSSRPFITHVIFLSSVFCLLFIKQALQKDNGLRRERGVSFNSHESKVGSGPRDSKYIFHASVILYMHATNVQHTCCMSLHTIITAYNKC